MTGLLFSLFYGVGWFFVGKRVARWHYEDSHPVSEKDSIALGAICGLAWPIVAFGWLMYTALHKGWGFDR